MNFKKVALALVASTFLLSQGIALGTGTASTAGTAPTVGTATPVATPAGGASLTRPISGGFIQFDATTKSVPKETWQKMLQKCKAAGVNTIILQYCSFTPNNADAPMYFDKETDAIMALAEEMNLDVYAGLALANEWFTIENELYYASGPKVGIARKNFDVASPWVVTTLASAQHLHDKYGSKHCFKGYYIPQELDDRLYQDDNQEDIISVFKAISQKCKELDPDKDVLVSVFCSEIGRAAAAKTDRFYTNFLRQTKIPVLLVQDSVGKMKWKIKDLGDTIPQFFTPFQNACTTTGTKIWADVECFQNPNSPEPCAYDRLHEQLSVESSKCQVDKFVVFDLNHHFDPTGSDAAKKLFDDYEKHGAGTI